VAILGLSGLFGTEHDDPSPDRFQAFYHDSAAALVASGRTLAAVEEERLSREKHSNHFPGAAARACLEVAGVRPAELTGIAYFFDEAFTDVELDLMAAGDPQLVHRPSRETVVGRLSDALGADLSGVPVHFARHHDAHAASAFYDSGLSRALVVVSDGNGEAEGISVYLGEPGGLRRLHAYPREQSLGHFYTAVTRLLGYREFDEYKVMGLASSGDPRPWRSALDGLYALGPAGTYRLDHATVLSRLIRAGARPRRAWEPLTASHRDLAAAAQEALERVTLHVVRHWLAETGLRTLCLAGGVAQNTSLNGRLLGLGPGVLDEVTVPASPHDAGAALGAAMLVDAADRPPPRSGPGRRYTAGPFLGPHLGEPAEVAARLAAWTGLVEVDQVDDLEREIAAELAAGAVVGWAQGRSEFGPRALGNRSILADPRPAANRDRVNRLVKKREDYRPFAPVVPEPHAGRFFDLGDVRADHSHMGFVVDVLPAARSALGAVTHIDGTARVQVLRPGQNPALWSLLTAFGELTGVPVLLNTSFNNYAEPIVQTVDDAVACLLSTGLTLLGIDRYRVRPVGDIGVLLRGLRVALMPFCRLVHTVDRTGERWAVVRTPTPGRRTEVSETCGELLRRGGSVADRGLGRTEEDPLAEEVRLLWDRRLVRLMPPG
jgi:predicted NodU family carbamoyl transferase